MKNILKTILFALVVISCGSDDNDTPNPDTDTDAGTDLIPEAVDLISPSKDSKCNIGILQSSTESTINFSWSSGKNANSYDVVLTNLTDNTTQTLTTVNTELGIRLLQGVEYSWHVVSKSTTTEQTSNSAEWKMLNSKMGEQNYAPFPSDILNPKKNDIITGMDTTLAWKGNDTDNDIESYDVYLGTSNPPTTKLSSTTKDVMTVSSGTLTADTTYYWFVTTIDAYGNKTKSTVVSFTSGN